MCLRVLGAALLQPRGKGLARLAWHGEGGVDDDFDGRKRFGLGEHQDPLVAHSLVPGTAWHACVCVRRVVGGVSCGVGWEGVCTRRSDVNVAAGQDATGRVYMTVTPAHTQGCAALASSTHMVTHVCLGSCASWGQDHSSASLTRRSAPEQP